MDNRLALDNYKYQWKINGIKTMEGNGFKQECE